MINTILSVAQIVISILLVTAILLQQRGASVGAAFGGGDTIHVTRRGVDQYLYISTIVLAVLFFATAITAFLLRSV